MEGSDNVIEKTSSAPAVRNLQRTASQRSNVWDHFSQPVDKKTVCQHCKGAYKFTGGTTNLINHLKSMHPSVLPEARKAIKTEAVTSFGTRPIGTFGATYSLKPCSGVKREQISELLVDWITSDMRPLGIVNDPGFRELLHFLEPGFTVPSRTTVTKMVRQRHEKSKKELIGKLKDAKAVSITTDGWTSKAVMSFVTYTVHFINPSWDLDSFVLETSQFEGSHTADNLATEVKAIVEKFAIPATALQCIVHDEAANAVAAGKKLTREEGWKSQVCAAHRLQTCIRHAISGSRAIEKVLATARRLVGHFHHSSKSTEVLRSRQVAMGLRKASNTLTLVQDVSTRWNSSFLMLDRLLALKLPVLAAVEDPATSCDESMKLKDAHWALAKEVVPTLAPFAKATTVLGGEKYCTSSLVVPVIHTLVQGLQSELNDASGTITGFRACLRTELKKKFQLDPLQPLALPSLCAAVDPRSRALTFLESEADQRCLKEQVVSVTRSLAETRQPSQTSEENSAAGAPPAKRAKLNTDEEAVSFFFGGSQPAESDPSVEIESEVQQYFSERSTTADRTANPLQWWKANANRYPNVARVAEQLLCTPATSVPAERVFSAAGLIVNKLRASLTAKNIDALIFLHANSSLKASRSKILAGLPSNIARATSVPREKRLQQEEEDDAPSLPDM